MKWLRFLFNKILFKKWWVLFIVLGSIGCNKPTATNKSGKKSSKSVNDSLLVWFNSNSNFAKPNYLAEFYKNYNASISSKNINEAATLLNAVFTKINNQRQFNDTIVELTKKFLTQYKTSVASRYIVSLNNLIGTTYTTDGKYLLAIPYLQKAISIKVSDKFGHGSVGNAYFNLAICYLEIGNPDSSFIANNKALEFYEKSDFKTNIPFLYQNIAVLYLYACKYDEAINSIDVAINMVRAANNRSYYYFYFLSTKKDIYLEMDDKKYYPIVDTLYQYYKDNDKHEDILSKVDAYTGIVIKYMDQKRYKEAKLMLDSTKALLIQVEESVEDKGYYMALSRYELALGKPISNRTFFEEEMSDLYAQKDYYNISSNYELLSDDAEIRKDYKLAFEYQGKIKVVEDSLFSQRDKILVADLQIKYETEKKEQEILLQKSTLTKNKFQIIGLLASLIAVTLGTILFLWYKKRKQIKLNIARQQQFTNDLMQNTEDERKRIATELHDAVSHELLSLKNNINQGKPTAEQDIEKIVQSIREISRNLYPAMFEQIGLVASIEALCERMTNAGLFTTSEINYNNQLNKRNELQLYRIIQEALTNTAKHAKANAAKITIETKGNELYVEIKDNGVGFDTSEKMQNAKSFGLQSIYQRAKTMVATSNMESNENGTKLILTTALY